MYANEMLDRIHQDANFLKNILWTDEATFTRGGYFNCHNMHHYAPENPHLVQPTRFQIRFKINVWAAIINNKIIGPVELPEIFDSEAYTRFLSYTLPRLLREQDIDINTIWFQQDGAPPHWGLPARRVLNRRFPNRWIGRNSEKF